VTGRWAADPGSATVWLVTALLVPVTVVGAVIGRAAVADRRSGPSVSVTTTVR
jgi:hypothetical protein